MTLSNLFSPLMVFLTLRLLLICLSIRCHRHIVKTGLLLLTHAKHPIEYWSYAFSTSSYLINRLPTPTLSQKISLSLLISISS